ncbi:AAA family ATPase [Vibrio sp. 1291-1]|uniref:AAA family ATPase n=1 Tax=Vibrio sp. 1291-1 TaxID=3074551 RepID=UPI00296B0BDB|nr:AAA family ATPase [Vibrio sp. 1291-1]MDW3640247.1 AAA family ATPase [Vibrio sp. 1291-1]
METLSFTEKRQTSDLTNEQLDSLASVHDAHSLVTSCYDSSLSSSKLTLVRGIPGSGKSTYANSLPTTVVVEADHYFINKDGAYRFDRTAIKDAHQWCQLETKRLLKAGYNVAVANTFVKNWEMKFYKSLADDMGLAFEVIEMKGNYQNVHGVSDAIVARMASQFEKLEDSLSPVTNVRG